MSTPPRQKTERAEQVTLLVTVALAVGLGGIVYLSSSSLPYLAASPSTDPTFGALNACLLAAVPERVGFAVSPDQTQVAAWSTNKLVVCAGSPPAPVVFERRGVTLGAFSFDNALWIAQGGRDAGPGGVWRLEQGTFAERATFAPAALVGTRFGVVALDPEGQLFSLGADGAIAATAALGTQRTVTLVADATGTLVSLFGGGKFSVIHGQTLAALPAVAPCPVNWVWWRPDSPLLLVECVDLVFEVNALTSESRLIEPRRRVRSVLQGGGGHYVQACDQLPCSVPPPP